MSVSLPNKPIQPSLIFEVKAESLAQSGASFRCSTWVSSSLTWKYQTKLERLPRVKHYTT
jgi:hypothetical protein